MLRYLVAQEVGKVISRDGTYGQVMGGVTQGIGYALHESLRIGSDGRYRERTFEHYRLPLAVDIPRVEFFPLSIRTPTAQFGAKGVAESPVLLPSRRHRERGQRCDRQAAEPDSYYSRGCPCRDPKLR